MNFLIRFFDHFSRQRAEAGYSLARTPSVPPIARPATVRSAPRRVRRVAVTMAISSKRSAIMRSLRRGAVLLVVHPQYHVALDLLSGHRPARLTGDMSNRREGRDHGKTPAPCSAFGGSGLHCVPYGTL